MKRIFVSAALILLLTTSAPAGDNWTVGLPAQSPLVVLQNPCPATRLQPVVGSVQRKSHFTNPFTHKAKYTNVMYNPILGTFSKQKYRG
jgi:hypothetical protein